VITGASREHSPLALELARQCPGELFATAGVHPHHATEYTAQCDAEMRELHTHSEVVAVGEGKALDNGSLRAPKVKVGDKVIYGQYSGSSYKHEGTEYKIVREDDILAVLG